ncbi:MAG: hypothetical protein MR639_15300 [Clostridium sp.]|uniref:hypothetical protein n=1 Tax=Clostridium sp. TaxID=1506 RepID=UPI002A8779C7|nr:hypothetical protein [Clostridium sp.]MDY4493780.1 hypothetical protein [Erysipelotrichaceae bacterium]MDY5098521.1 hypothetical protein [Clostridium sp.]
MKNIKLYTFWRDGKLECCCPPQNKCNKDHNCELMKFTYDEYEGSRECMKSRKYKRNKHGAIVETG